MKNFKLIAFAFMCFLAWLNPALAAESKWVDVSADVAVGYDSNPAQSGGSVSVSGGEGGGQGEGNGGRGGAGGMGGAAGKPSLGSRTLTAIPPVGDQVLTTNLKLSREIFDMDFYTSTFSVSGGASFFNQQHTYNYESINPEITNRFTFKPWIFGLDLSYLDTWYNSVHSQTYWTGTPSAKYEFTKEFSLKGLVELANATKENYSFNYKVALTAQYAFTKSAYVYFTISQLNANGEKAVISLPDSSNFSRSVISGSTFSNYVTKSASLGGSIEIPLEIDLSGSLTVSQTQYAQESFPQSNTQPEARLDNTAYWTVSVERPLIWDWLTAQAEVSYTNNAMSGGKLGALSAGTIPVYSYERWYYSAGLGASF